MEDNEVMAQRKHDKELVVQRSLEQNHRHTQVCSHQLKQLNDTKRNPEDKVSNDRNDIFISRCNYISFVGKLTMSNSPRPGLWYKGIMLPLHGRDSVSIRIAPHTKATWESSNPVGCKPTTR